MAAPTARIDYGTFTRSDGYNEANMIVDSVDTATAQDQTFIKDMPTGVDVIGWSENRSLTWSVSGVVKAVSGFVTQAPCTTVSSLANFASAFRTFDPTAGLMIFDDPKDSWKTGELRSLSFNVLHKPYIA